MEEDLLPDVGAKVRTLRQRRGLSLRELAERSTLSVNTISLVERGLMAPSVVTLQKLATALGVKITFFFEEPEAQEVIFTKASQRPRAWGAGVLMENLGSGLANQSVELLFIQLEAKARSGEQPVAHTGHEFILCLAGKIEYEIGGRHYRLEEGDSLLFEARLPHQWRNPSDSLATAILVFQATEGREESVQRHLTPAGDQKPAA